jgi:hypothetical protein
MTEPLTARDVAEFLNAIPGCAVEVTPEGDLHVGSLLSVRDGEVLFKEVSRALNHEPLDEATRSKLEGLRAHLKAYLFTWRYGSSPHASNWRAMSRDERVAFLKATGQDEPR